MAQHWQYGKFRNGTRLATLENASGTVDLDCNYNMFDIKQTGNIEFSFFNIKQGAALIIHIERTGAYSDTWPANVKPGDGVLPAPSVGPGLIDVYSLITSRTGAHWVIQPFALGVPV